MVLVTMRRDDHVEPRVAVLCDLGRDVGHLGPALALLARPEVEKHVPFSPAVVELGAIRHGEEQAVPEADLIGAEPNVLRSWRHQPASDSRCSMAKRSL